MATGTTLEEVPCGLCGSGRFRVLYDRPHELGSLTEAAFAATTDEFHRYGRIVRCLECGLVYTNPRPSKEALLAGYGSCVDESYLAESSSRSINAHLSLNTIKRFVKSGRLLEVGASTGYFLNAARVDFDVAGIEPSDWARRIAAERFKLDVSAEPVESATRFAPASFDAAAMVDVLEHLADPAGALAATGRLLKPGGILYLVTPDIGSLSARLLRGYWWGLRPAHVCYFDRRTLGRALDKSGFDVAFAKSFGRIFSMRYWASRLRNYPEAVSGAAGSLIRLLGLEDKLVYIDTRDSIEVCARKR